MKDITTFRGEAITPAINYPEEKQVWVDTMVFYTKKFVIIRVDDNIVDFDYESGYEGRLTRDEFIEKINTYEFRYLGSLRNDLVKKGSLK